MTELVVDVTTIKSIAQLINSMNKQETDDSNRR